VAVTVVRTSRRRAAAKAVFVALLVLHGALVIRALDDPHKLFGFRPFNESDAWTAEIVRITVDGARRPIDDGTWAYEWDELVGTPKLTRPERFRHVWYEATVTVVRNAGDPETHVLRKGPRDLS
jgi:hypothetical protein